MNRMHTAITAAILASSMAGTVALAGDGAYKQQAGDQPMSPATQQDAQTGAGPDVRDLDSNAQRAHDPSGNAAGAAAGTEGSTGAGAPSVKDLDNNAQRAHQPEGGAAAKDGVSSESSGSGNASAGGSAGGDTSVAASGDTRDWSQVDANNDNLISPTEMEEALKATGPQAGQQR